MDSFPNSEFKAVLQTACLVWQLIRLVSLVETFYQQIQTYQIIDNCFSS